MSTPNENTVRYGISALDYRYKEQAVKDELMVHGGSGKMFYKRETDGQVVTYEAQDYTKETLFEAVRRVAYTENVLLKDNYLVYSTIDITEKNSMVSKDLVSLGASYEFKIDEAFPHILFRLHGNTYTNNVATFLESKVQNPVNKFVLLHLIIKTETEEFERTIGVEFNQLYMYHVDIEHAVSVVLTGFEFPEYKTVYDNLTSVEKSVLSEINLGNTNHEASTIDVVASSKTIPDLSLYFNRQDNLEFKCVVNVPAIMEDEQRETWVFKMEDGTTIEKTLLIV